MSENVDAVDNGGNCKLQKLSTGCHLDTETLIGSSSDMATCMLSLLSVDAGDAMLQTVDLLPNLQGATLKNDPRPKMRLLGNSWEFFCA